MLPVDVQCQLQWPDPLPAGAPADAVPGGICGHKNPTLSHVLSCCKVALYTGRFTWRHDSVLQVFVRGVESLLVRINNSSKSSGKRRPVTFVRQGGGRYDVNVNLPVPAPSSLADTLALAHDWELLCELPGRRYNVFPPEIASTTLLPDIILRSSSTRTAVLLELTCPAEARVKISNKIKSEKYNRIIDDASANGWSVIVRPFEISVLGLVSKPVWTILTSFRVPHSELLFIQRQLENVAMRTSHYLYIARHTAHWAEQALLDCSPLLVSTHDDHEASNA